MKSILITGANRGIGLTLVKKFYDQGFKVIACCRSPDNAKELTKLCGDSNHLLEIISLDVTDENAIASLPEKTNNQPIDILINNAGVYLDRNQGGYQTVNESDWILGFKINTIAPLLISRILLNQIEKSQLKIIAMMSSKMGSINDNTSGGSYIYRSSKTAINMVVKSLAHDLQSKAITVVTLHPGWVKTDMGGPNGLINTDECTTGLYNVLNHLTLNDSGKFIAFDGSNIPW